VSTFKLSLLPPLSLRPILLALALSLTACGGGGGGDDTGAPPPDDGGGSDDGGDGSDGDGNDPPDTGALNGGLEGKLYFETADAYSELDLATGLVRSLGDLGSARSAADGESFASLENGNDYSLRVVDLDGATRARVEVALEVNSTPRPSPDGTRLAAYAVEAGSERLTVFTLDGRTDWRADQDYASFDWLPDGGLLLLGADEQLYRSDASYNNLQLLADLSGQSPAFVSASPDGQQIAVTLGDRSTLDNHVWLMAIDGSGLEQLTTSDINEDGIGWSPDGAWMVVRWGIAYSGAGIPGRACPELMLVPTDRGTIDVGAPDSSAAIAVERYTDGDLGSGVCGFSQAEWRSPQQTLSQRQGQISSGSGANQGLGGALFYYGTDGPVTVTLDSGVTTSVPVDDSYVHGMPSADGTLLVYTQSEADSGSGEQLTVQDFAGNKINGFSVSGQWLGYPQLSPDDAQIAVLWSDGSADPVLATVARSGAQVLGQLANVDDWTWLPDGRLLLVRDTEIAIADATLSNIETLFETPDPVSDITASPNGSRLAFSMDGHIWTATLQGDDLAPLTVSASSENSPAWLGDGSQIAFRHVADCSLAYAAPSDGVRVMVGEAAAETSARSLMRDDDGSLRNICTGSRIATLP